MMELSGTNVLPVFLAFADKEKKGMYTGFKGLENLKFVDTSLG